MPTATEFNTLYAELEKQIAPAKLSANPQDQYFNGALIAEHIQKNLGGNFTVDNMHRAVKALRMSGLRWDVEPRINLRDKGLLKPEEENILDLNAAGPTKEERQAKEDERNRSEYRSAANNYVVYRGGRIDHPHSEESRATLNELIAQCEAANTPTFVILELVTAKVAKLLRDYENRISRSNGGRNYRG
jgi:hypothetical protein